MIKKLFCFVEKKFIAIEMLQISKKKYERQNSFNTCLQKEQLLVVRKHGKTLEHNGMNFIFVL